MDNFDKLSILNDLKPCLRLLTAYKFNNFERKNWRYILHTIFYGFFSTMTILATATYVTLGIWDLVNNGDDLETISAALPVLIGFLQMAMTYIALMWTSSAIVETITQLDTVIKQRKSQMISIVNCQKNGTKSEISPFFTTLTVSVKLFA